MSAGQLPGNQTIRALSTERYAPAAACLVAGILSAFGFGSDAELAWLFPILALAVLFVCIAGNSKGWASLHAYLFGLGHFTAGASWTWASLYNYGSLPLPLAGLISVLLSAGLALYYAAAAAIAVEIGGRRAAAVLIALPGCWLILEILRGQLFTGFNWLAAGYAQTPPSPLAGLIPLIGVSGTTGVAAAAAAGIAGALILRSKRCRLLALALPVGLIASGALLRLVSWTEPADEPIATSILQGAVPQDQQWRRANIAKIPRRYLELAQRSTGRLIIAPENTIPAVLPKIRDEIFVGELKSILELRDGAAIVGSFGRDEQRERHTNSAFAIDATGIAAEYRKRKLAPYGEYLPFADFFEPLLERARIPYSRLVPGDSDGKIALGFVDLSISICYEDAFADLLFTNDAPIIVNLTNDSWFDGTAMPYQHLQIAAARALENGRWLLRASNTGPSAAIHPDGTVAAQLAVGEQGVIDTQAVPYMGTTPYRWWGDWPAWLAGLAALALAWRMRES